MRNITGIINNFSLFMGRMLVSKNGDIVNKLSGDFSKLDDATLQQRCRDLFTGVAAPGKKYQIRFWDALLRRILFFLPKPMDAGVLERLACGIEAFSRCPADLGEGAFLYPSQTNAAIALVQSCVLQMDTGEGKTYALLPAAFTLACMHGRVYVICANEYLAFRDANRTRNYWNYTGLNVQFAPESAQNNKECWDGDVIYTTLTAILFKQLNDTISKIPTHRRMNTGALILDEADSILLDAASSGHSLVTLINANAFNWSFAITYSGQLQEETDIKVDYTDMTASLTIEGEAKLQATLKQRNVPLAQYELLRMAVETSFIAQYAVQENRDYIRQGNKIYPIDRGTGEIRYNQVLRWMIPLQIIYHIPPSAHRVTLLEISPRTFLTQFAHISGMSGTVIEDAAEYFWDYKLPTVAIAPRNKRYDGLKQDAVYRFAYEAVAAITNDAVAYAKARRPVLIGTQSIKEADDVYQALITHPDLPEETRVALITGKNEADIAAIYQEGGVPGSVIVATQLAGRGVDIRLTDEARQNGGMALLCLEHSRTMRHDKQFLGRVGRGGDPFTAIFYVSLESRLMQDFGSMRIASMMDKLGYKEGDVIQHSMITKSIRRAQRQIREIQFINRRYSDKQIATEGVIFHNFRIWPEYLYASGDSNDSCNELFIRYVTDHFLTTNIKPLLKGAIGPEQARQIVAMVNSLLETQRYENWLQAARLEGKQADWIEQYLREAIMQLLEKNATLRNKRLAKERNFLPVFDRRRRLDHAITRCRQLRTITSTGNPDPALQAAFPVWATTLRHQLKHGIGSTEDMLAMLAFFSFAQKNIQHFDTEMRSLTEAYFDAVSSIDKWIEWKQMQQASVQRLEERSPVKIAHWSLMTGMISFYKLQNRTRHQLVQKGMRLLQYNWRLASETMRHWEKTESGYATEILRNLLVCHEPGQLDELFFYPDNTTNEEEDSELQRDSKALEQRWQQTSGNVQSLRRLAQQEEAELVTQFLRMHESELGIKISHKSLGQTLGDFIRNNPLNSLQTPEKIMTAMESWKIWENNTGIAVERKPINHKWIKKFLLYLHKQNRIGILPTYRHKLRFLFSGMVANVKEASVLVTAVQMLLGLLLFALFSIKTGWIQPLTLHSYWQHFINNLLCAGWLDKGIVTAPIFLAVILSDYKNNNILLRFGVATSAAAVMAFGVIQVFSWWAMLKALLITVLLAYLYNYFIKLMHSVDHAIDLSLHLGWVCFSIAFAFVPAIGGYLSLPALVLGGAALLYLLTFNWYNKTDFTLLTTHITGSYATLETELHRTAITVEGNTRITPHLYALLFIILVNSFEPYLLPYTGPMYPALLLLLYAVIVILVVQDILSRRFAARSWQLQLNDQRQILINGNNTEANEELDLAATLRRARRKLFWKEILLHLLVLGGGAALLWGRMLPDTAIPLALPVIFAGWLFAVCASGFVVQLYHALVSRVSMKNDVLDFNEIKESKEDLSFMEQVKEWFRSYRKTRKILNLLFIAFAIAYTVYRMVRLLGH